MDLVAPDPTSLTSLHAIAEHVLATVLHQATGRIGLRVSLGGFSIPPFGDDGGTVRVEGVTLVVGSPGTEQRAPLTTLGAAAELAGIEPGAPTSVFTPSAGCDADAPLDIDPGAARALAEWYALADAALRRWAARLCPCDPAAATLWPEHFDVAIRAHDVNYGASPGDDGRPSPYLSSDHHRSCWRRRRTDSGTLPSGRWPRGSRSTVSTTRWPSSEPANFC